MTGNGTTNGSTIARVGDIHGNAERIRGLQDLAGVRTQLADTQSSLADAKNAYAELREVLVKINRMVGGQGWTDASEVIAAVQRRLDKYSNGRAAELEETLAKQDEVEKALRAALKAANTRADQAVKTAGTLRQDAQIAKQDYAALKERYEAQQKELERMGRMQVVAAKPLANEERDALIALLDMEREDHTKLLRDILQAAANAEREVRKAELPMMTGSRSINYFNRGLLMGCAAVEAAIARVIHNIQPKDIEQDHG